MHLKSILAFLYLPQRMEVHYRNNCRRKELTQFLSVLLDIVSKFYHGLESEPMPTRKGNGPLGLRRMSNHLVSRSPNMGRGEGSCT
jgi:hypothetical protein